MITLSAIGMISGARGTCLFAENTNGNKPFPWERHVPLALSHVPFGQRRRSANQRATFRRHISEAAT
jgi:hypothetical protein